MTRGREANIHIDISHIVSIVVVVISNNRNFFSPALFTNEADEANRRGPLTLK